MKIKLTKGKETIIDDSDAGLVRQYKWWCDSHGYAVSEVKGQTILLHRILLNAPRGLDVDHINHNPLDNRRENLRLATRSQNKANVLKIKRKYTELPMGVTYNSSLRTKQPYTARVCCRGKSYFVGNFYHLKDAEEAYRVKKKDLFGEFA